MGVDARFNMVQDVLLTADRYCNAVLALVYAGFFW
jgi:hypothetical protein